MAADTWGSDGLVSARGLFHSGMMRRAIREEFVAEARRVAQQYAEIMYDQYENARLLGPSPADINRMVDHLESFRAGQADELWRNHTQRHLKGDDEAQREQARESCSQEVRGAFAPALRWVHARAEEVRLGRGRRILKGTGKILRSLVPKFGSGS